MIKALHDKDNLFLFLHLSFCTLMLEAWGLYYILLCYLTDNIWWGDSFEWFGTVLNWVF